MDLKYFKEISQFHITCNDGDDVWFVGDSYALIFQMSLKDNNIKRVIRIEGDEFEEHRQYLRMEKVESKLILIPCNSDRIVIFHTDTNKFSSIRLNRALVNCSSSVKNGKTVYLIDDVEIIVVDTEREKILDYIAIPPYGNLSNGVSLLIDGHLVILLNFESGVIDFDIAKRNFNYFRFDSEFGGFVAGVVDGMDIWLAGHKGSILKWNYTNKEVDVFDKPPKNYMSFNYDKKGNFMPWGEGWIIGISFQYRNVCVLLDMKVWFIPMHSNSLLYIDKKSGLMKKYTFEGEDETEWTIISHNSVKFLFVGVYENRYLKIYSGKRNLVYSIDVVKLTHTEETISFANINASDIEKEYWDNLYRKSMQSGIAENSSVSITELRTLINRNDVVRDADGAAPRIGTYIYENI